MCMLYGVGLLSTRENRIIENLIENRTPPELADVSGKNPWKASLPQKVRMNSDAQG
jgi:hypothetical protein